MPINKNDSAATLDSLNALFVDIWGRPDRSGFIVGTDEYFRQLAQKHGIELSKEFFANGE